MRGRKLVYTSVAVIVCRGGLCIESPVSSSPLGVGTVPPSAYRSGLIPSISPIDTSGNLVVTGNVAGGMYFRGIVPYRGVVDFGTATTPMDRGSAEVESFIRRSAGSQDFGRSGGVTPYYSQTWAVTKMAPETSTAYAGQGGLSGGYGTEQFSRVGSPREQYQRGYLTQSGKRPLSMSQQELEKIINPDVTGYPQGGEPVLQTESSEQFWMRLRVPMGTRLEPAKGDVGGVKQWELGAGAEPNIGMLLNMGRESQPAVSGRDWILQRSAKALEGVRGPDVYEQMKIKLGKPATDVLELAKGISGQTSGQIEANEPAAEAGAALSDDLSVGAAASVEDVYKSFAAYRDDRFNKHIMAAESYMKQGRYYRAADAYTLAIVYKPDDPLGYAGKSHALFASGEYLSSALFLARAIEIFPEYVKFRIDLVGMIGDKDTVENRILEAREWLDRSGSGELEFLLSYIYYRMDRLEFARLAIESAAKKRPGSQAVAVMKKAIEERIASF
jgi:hypothetical protein